MALVLTTLFWLPPVASRLLPEELVWRNLASQGADWFFALGLIAIVVCWEKRPLSSLGFKPLKVENLCAGLGLGGFLMVGVVVWTYLLAPMVPGLEGATGQDRNAENLPDNFFLWFAPLALVTASFCEEVIYRGYAMERLLRVTKSPWLAVVLSHIAFVLYHLKDGWESVLMLSFMALLFPLYYLRFRDLTMMIVAHAFIDLMAIVGHFAGIGPR